MVSFPLSLGPASTHGLRLIGVNREELVGHCLERDLHRGWDEEVDVGDLM